VPPVSLEDEARALAELEELRAANRRLLAQLERARATKAELVEAVYAAALDAARALVIDPVPPPPAKRRGRPEVSVLVCSDWQLGKRTPTYDSQVAAKRIELLAAKARRIARLHRAARPVEECHVWLLGDLVEGELIFPGQAHRIDASLYRQVVEIGPRLLAGLLRSLLADFARVHVVGVIGNHGAIGGPYRREMHPESNADLMLYRIAREILAGEPRLTWQLPDVPGERGWWQVDRIGRYSALLVHGDQIRGGFAGYPWYGLGKRVLGWYAGAVPEAFSEVALGHWHQTGLVTLGRLRAWANGTTESDNTYAAEQMASAGRPEQWLLFVDPAKGRVTASYILQLDEDTK
jgi:hypothetical protein